MNYGDTTRTQTARSSIDVFMDKMFKFGKVITAIIMFLSMLCMVSCLCYLLFAKPSKLVVPTFGGSADRDVEYEEEFSDNKVDPAIGLKYNTEIKRITKLIGKSTEYRRRLVSIIDRVPVQYRDAFVAGLIEYLEDAKRHAKGNMEDRIESYVDKFKWAISTVENDIVATQSRKREATIALVSSIGSFVCFLIIPLLIRIEENTRK